MKLLTYDTGAGPRCGVLRGDDVVDVSALLGAAQPLQDVRALLELGESAVDRVRDALAGNPGAQAVPLSGVRLRSPVLQPPTVRDFMIYEEHATAQGTRERKKPGTGCRFSIFPTLSASTAPTTTSRSLRRQACSTMNWSLVASSAGKGET